MRKTILAAAEEPSATPFDWLRLEEIAQVAVTSEDAAHPIEAALTGRDSTGWRANAPGEQTIRLRFDEPQSIRRIELLFKEEIHERQQEFTLSYLGSGDMDRREIVRQQYNFSPAGSTVELEAYDLSLPGVRELELRIIPDRGGGAAVATLTRLRLA